MTKEDILHHFQDINFRYNDCMMYDDLSRMLDELIAENKGEWIEKAEDYYKAINEYGGGVDENTDYFTDDIACPKCLSKFSTIDNETERFNFCPNCGADMRGEHDFEN